MTNEEAIKSLFMLKSAFEIETKMGNIEDDNDNKEIIEALTIAIKELEYKEIMYKEYIKKIRLNSIYGRACMNGISEENEVKKL